MGGSPTTPKVLGALNDKFVGKVVTIDQLVKATGLGEQQIRHSMLKLVNGGDVRLEVNKRGHTWSYFGPATAADPEEDEEAVDGYFEVVGRTQSGEVIVRGDATDTLYKVVPL